MIETEVKLRVDSLANTRSLLRHAGFRLLHRRTFEANLMLDTPSGTLRASGRLLRLRQAGSQTRLTFKDKAQPGPHKNREELETGLTDFEIPLEIFSRLGFQKTFRYEKYRTEYADPHARHALAMLDETPIGNFLELEGPPKWIDRRARDLGFSPTDYIIASYGTLYLEHCRKLRVTPSDMTFE